MSERVNPAGDSRVTRGVKGHHGLPRDTSYADGQRRGLAALVALSTLQLLGPDQILTEILTVPDILQAAA